MKITIDATLFRDCMKAVSGLVDEVEARFSESEMNIKAMDAANIGMVVFKLPSTSAIEWDVNVTDEEPEEKICFALNKLVPILKRTGADDILKIETVNEDTRLKVEISGYKKFFLPLIETDSKKQDVPELDHKVVISLPTKKLNEAIDDCELVGESIKFTGSEKLLELKSETDIAKAIIELEGEDVDIEGEFTDDKQQYQSKFATDYLHKIVLKKVDDQVTVSLGDEYPVQVLYKTDKFKMMFILAPRVEND